LHAYTYILSAKHPHAPQIDDISFVVDTGRVKETRYDPSTHMSSLVAVYTSKAAASQRAGRAGRVRAGDCFRLYTQEFFETQMPEYTLPEMLRTPLVSKKKRMGGVCVYICVCL
jgi:HrpA-like RNA helicase